MAGHERRNAVALDDAYFYCRQLENRAERAELYKVCNAIRTLDLALEAHEESPMPMTLCAEAWQRVRDSLFATLIASFPGYFFVYDEYETAVEPGAEWPERGHLEFFPDGIHRKNESYHGEFHRLPLDVLNPLRWAFAESRQHTEPEDFVAPVAATPDAAPDAARELLDRLYNVCEEQAHEGKKKAHRKWWQLYWEANSCPNKRTKHELQKQMVKLQSIWGTPEE
jgi:hypothetical protein